MELQSRQLQSEAIKALHLREEEQREALVRAVEGRVDLQLAISSNYQPS